MNVAWYLDGNGNIGLETRDGEIYNKDGESIGEYDSRNYSRSVYFVPLNKNVVYCFRKKIYKIDLLNNAIAGVYDNPCSNNNYAVVKSSDCSRTWLFDVKNSVVSKYNLTDNGIEKTDYQYVLPVTTKNGFENDNWCLNFSKNCDFFTLSYIKSHDKNPQVFFGKFDRLNGIITDLYSYTFPNDITTVNNSIVAPDDSRIYYMVLRDVSNIFQSKSYYEYFEVPIVDGEPMYDMGKNIHAYEQRGGHSICDMLYGPDNRIYLMNYAKKRIDVIEIQENNETKFTESFFDVGYVFWDNRLHFPTDWHTDNPCREYEPCNVKAPVIICE